VYDETTSVTQISAYTARQKANVFVLENISNLLLANTPELVQIENKWLWQVPIDITLSGKGRIGRVGEIMIDATYGAVQYDESLIPQITASADQLLPEFKDS